jgi:hypothetical protein
MTEEEKGLIEVLCKVEAPMINQFYKVNDAFGGKAFKMAIVSFSAFLRESEGPFVPGMNIKYRHFMVTLLGMIDEPYRGHAVSVAIIGR